MRLIEEADKHILSAKWLSLRPLLEAARAEYAGSYADLSARQLLDALAGGAALQITPSAERPLIVALSYHIYPSVTLIQGTDSLLLVVGTRGQEVAPDPDPGTIRVLKALADATRLRILEL